MTKKITAQIFATVLHNVSVTCMWVICLGWML